MASAGKEAWTPIHDQAGLDKAIKRLAEDLYEQYYLPSLPDLEPCQGDILEFTSGVPILDEVGEVSAEGDVRYWVVASNTCDATRAYRREAGVMYATIVPLWTPEQLGYTPEMLGAARACSLYRAFYVPSWDNEVGPHIADFTRFVPLHREALRDVAQVRARMSQPAWTLLNGCLVRLLSREDKRSL